MAVARARYRVAQFVGAVRARFEPIDLAYVRAQLRREEDPDALLRLFRGMSKVEQQHGILVCQTLERQGYADPHLLVAALLHDVGKSVAPPRLWERVLVVIVEHLLPRRAKAWGSSPADLKGIRRAFVVRQYHTTWGAELAAEAGASAQTVALIRRHHAFDGPDPDPLLKALQMADESTV